MLVLRVYVASAFQTTGHKSTTLSSGSGGPGKQKTKLTIGIEQGSKVAHWVAVMIFSCVNIERGGQRVSTEYKQHFRLKLSFDY